MDPRLLITNIGFLISLVATLGLGIFVLFRGLRKIAHFLFFLMSVSVAIFMVAHLAGINAFEAEESRRALLWTLAIIPMTAFTAHWALAVSGKNREKRRDLVLIYAAAVTLTTFFAFFPQTFLLPSAPKMYLPNYYEPGAFHWVYPLYLLLVIFYSLFQMFSVYKISDSFAKNKIKYFMLGPIIGYGAGMLAFAPVFDLPVDPIFSVLLGLYVIPMAYGYFSPEPTNLRQAIKRLIVFIFFSVMAAGGFWGIVWLGNFVAVNLSPLSPLAVYIAFGFVVVGGVMFFRRRAQLADTLKYEFIAVVTHKLRAPLTHIKWTLNEWSNARQDSDKNKIIEQIGNANKRLTELSDVLMGLVKIDAGDYKYNFEKRDLARFADDALEGLFQRIKEKGINLVKNYESGLPEVSLDEKRFRFALQVIVENSVNYTKRDGAIEVKLARDSRTASVLISIKDSGIGITREELPHLFSKFYRAGRARAADSEGMGIGLYMVKKIVERHNGKIWVESAGLDRGATFFISLPASI